MPAMPIALTAAMSRQALPALIWLKEKEHSDRLLNPESYTIRELRGYVVAYYTRDNRDPKDAKLDHNIRATTLAAWFPGIRAIP